MSPWIKQLEDTTRAFIMMQKKVKRPFKNKAANDPFCRTVKVQCSQLDSYMSFKMRLDTGCEAHNLIAWEVIDELGMVDDIVSKEEAICSCLNGEQLFSIGTVTLRWKGKDFRKVFKTTFHVIAGDFLPWQIILGAETIHEHSILKFAGFGGRPYHQKESTEEKARREARKEEHRREVAKNKAKVDAHKSAKHASGENSGSSSRSSSGPSTSG